MNFKMRSIEVRAVYKYIALNTDGGIYQNAELVEKNSRHWNGKKI